MGLKTNRAIIWGIVLAISPTMFYQCLRIVIKENELRAKDYYDSCLGRKSFTVNPDSISAGFSGRCDDDIILINLEQPKLNKTT